ncbi:zinc finger CCCH domain-containing protein 20-like [Olea europaea var. sylvestris]|uniref:zinc finger CCCH domain-containing protein 20-like n=1 Tax=Olea europaea var. sylvestris TaxID=158386 RepID=UPI000C1D3C7B|nr:zinc finger CCCH domain-containing protein 20-like [Olea europaea var. sylvestris]
MQPEPVRHHHQTMMIGERNQDGLTVHVPPIPWSFTTDDPASYNLSPNMNINGGSATDDCSIFTALQRYLPSNSIREGDLTVDAYTCDHFRMFEFKVRKCSLGKSHDWTECPYAHPGEKARRRDPRKFHYSGSACPEFRKGNCRKGDACEYAHGVFECWLHPARYRTQPCKDGLNCKRRVCFFAHSTDQLRVLSPRAESYDGSPHRLAFMSSSDSGSPPTESPPMSPMTSATATSISSLSRSLGSNSINEMIASLRQLQLNKVKSIPPSRNLQVGCSSSGLGSPRFPITRPGCFSLPTTPTKSLTRASLGYADPWEKDVGYEEEPAMERIESGRDLRDQMFEKLSKENPLGNWPSLNANQAQVPNHDVDWVSDMLN